MTQNNLKLTPSIWRRPAPNKTPLTLERDAGMSLRFSCIRFPRWEAELDQEGAFPNLCDFSSTQKENQASDTNHKSKSSDFQSLHLGYSVLLFGLLSKVLYILGYDL